MSPLSCPAGPSRPARWWASTCRSPPPSSARATTPSPRTSCGRPPDDGGPTRPAHPDGEVRRPEPDRWLATVVPDREGRWTFRVEAWSDPLATWHHAVEVKVEAGQGAEDLANDLEEGARLLDRVAAEADAEHRDDGHRGRAALRDTSLELTAGSRRRSPRSLQAYLHEHPVRELVTRSPRLRGLGRPAARAVRLLVRVLPAVGGRRRRRPGRRTARSPPPQERLPAIADMGFDVVYLPPIHPIGRSTARARTPAGPGGNPTDVGPDDVGSPWAIGSAEGGHDAVHPQLGTMEDFRAFVARTRELGMEVALDFALQAAPDHPWVESTRSGSPPSPTAPSPTRRTRRRSTRTSTRSTSTTTPRASTPSACG